MDLTKDYYEKEKEYYQEQIRVAERLVELNKYLKGFNWIFPHPYMFGFEVSRLEEYKNNKNGTSDSILSVFASSFFDLRVTSLFIDGIFKKRMPLAPFCLLIDQSVIMCLQKDYAGAIHALLSVIEGSIREYQIQKKGKTHQQIMKSEGLLKIFFYIKDDYIRLKQTEYESVEIDGDKLSRDRIKQLIKYQRKLVDTWFSILEEYFKNNLYLDTRNGVVNDNLNRHSIIHAFTTDIYYNLSNYLKLFNCLNFLGWAYGLVEGKNNVEATNKGVMYKWKAFEKIRAISSITEQMKLDIYSQYTNFPSSDFIKNHAPDRKHYSLSKQIKANTKSTFEDFDDIMDGLY